MKKTYQSPELQVIQVTTQTLLAASPDGFNDVYSDQTELAPGFGLWEDEYSGW